MSRCRWSAIIWASSPPHCTGGRVKNARLICDTWTPLYTQADASLDTAACLCVVQRPLTAWCVLMVLSLGGEPRLPLSPTASDYLPLEPALRRHGKFWLEPGLKSASLDHAMWFHRPARADGGCWRVLDSPSAQGGRMLAQGSIFNRSGELVATDGAGNDVPPAGISINETPRTTGRRQANLAEHTATV